MSQLLVATDVAKSYDGRAVLRGVTFAVDPGHRTGLVGENGSGKSTLLRILAGTLRADGGGVTRPADVGFLHQEFPFPADASVRDVVGHALTGVRAVEAALGVAAEELATGTSSAAAAYDRALTRAELAQVWDADVRAARTLAGLRLGDPDSEFGDIPVGRLSGGQRTRLGLAALLIAQPAALLLDEPTNHLDDDAAEYLALALRALPGAVVLASHDRVFLDEVATEILDLDPAAGTVADGGPAATLYGGTYSDYREAKRVERERWEARFTAEQQELRDLRRSVAVTARDVAKDRERGNQAKILYDFKGERVQGQISRRVRNAQQRLDALDRDQVRKPPPPLRFAPPEGRRGGPAAGLALWAREVSVDDGAGSPRLDMVAAGVPALEIPGDGRILVTGANGAGKSTLLHVLAGDLAPTRGTVGRRRGVSVGLLEQDDGLGDDPRTPRRLLSLLQGSGDGDTDGDTSSRVDAFGLVAPRDLDRPLRELSVGGRRRVVLAMLTSHAPDVLLLDEPTNHVSLTLAEELMAALADWPGAVVVASHDRWLRRGWTGDVVNLAPGTRA
ncbi:ABC transporter related [Beutenbergia cavernae DSM 12333]|uniref:ABC transporter related n=1 Tax=Beutenbergia cavernae (strain ATCC BAA-8 / DSM 12333 / CCUG 43141 / JCM 11478 / NBRC 16432 / NCIMB 13614 / HKI 0122) TaxID=471853 RepID=C5BZ61_BEUC1|nr:ABC-F family ATP-binding cassette domain-containing protein [Beutenbergia cavernae]ACQ81176.1 ABC transporter related [Beutenbergia cavernae DSM 12333]